MRLSITITLICLTTIATTLSAQRLHVLVFGVDGMSPDGVRRANTPNMHRMMREGASTLHARAVLPTSSSPNWASMICGAGPEKHGITSNSWERNDDGIAPAVIGEEGIFPTIFSVVRHGLPDAEIGVVHDWDGFARLVEKTKVNYISHQDGPYKTVGEAARYIVEKKPDFLFMHLDNVDGAGHDKGHGSPEYYAAVGLADSLLGVVEEACKKAGIYENTIFLIAADHGGIGHGHGGESMAELEIPFILCGKGIKKGYEIRRPVIQYDNAATVAYMWRLETPSAWTGRPVTSAFKGNPDDAPAVEEHFLLDPPQVGAPTIPGNAAGGLYIDSIPEVLIRTEPGVRVFFSTDGSEPTEKSTPYKQPFQLAQSTVLKVRSFDSRGNESPVVNAYYRVIKKSSLHPMKYGYYELDKLEVLPDFKSLEPKSIGQCNEFNLDEIPNRGENFALVLGGYIYIEKDGDYKFYLASDDGSRLYLDDDHEINNDGTHGAIWHGLDVSLTRGWHKLKVTYFNGGGGMQLKVYYRGPGIPKQPIPVDVLYGEKK